MSTRTYCAIRAVVAGRCALAALAVSALIAILPVSVDASTPSGDPEECPYPTFSFLPADQPVEMRSMAVGDFDGDSDMDVAGLRFEPEVVLTVFLNDGAGNLTLIASQNIDASSDDSLVAADLNADGMTDLLLVKEPSGNGQIPTLISNGDGTFDDGRLILTGVALRHATVVDLDMDGDVDIVPTFLFGGIDHVLWLRNDLSQGFSVQTIPFAGVGISKTVVADVDADGDPDLVATRTSAPLVTVLLNNGQGEFPEEDQFTTQLVHPSEDIHLADVTGDGLPDLIGLLYGSGSAKIYTNSDGNHFKLSSETELPYLAVWPPVFADVNGDGAKDLLRNFFGVLQIFPSDGEGAYLNPQESLMVEGGLATVVPAHMDEDGLIDLIATNENPAEYPLNVLINRGNGVDCDMDGIADGCEIAADSEADCNGNSVLDVCDLASGTSSDCNDNGVPDECDFDCNANGVPDECDLENGDATDYNGNGLLDECEFQDCNDNGMNDIVETGKGIAADCNANFFPDECELDQGLAWDDGGMEYGVGYVNPSQPINVLWAARFHGGDGVVVDAVHVAFPNFDDDQYPIGEPLEVFVWDDPDNDGFPDDAVLVRSGSAPIEVLVEVDDIKAVFNEIPVEPVSVTGTFFVGALYQIEPGEGEYFPIATDANSTFVPNRNWLDASYEKVSIQSADPFSLNEVIFMIRAGVLDCNDSGVLDTCEIAKGKLPDENNDGVADDCQCIAEITGDDEVGTADLHDLLATWGDCPPDGGCIADLDGSLTVDAADLLLLLANWGPCK